MSAGLQYPPSGLACFIYWNDEEITLDEYDEIWLSFQYKTVIRFRGKMVLVTALEEDVPDIQSIKLTGIMI